MPEMLLSLGQLYHRLDVRARKKRCAIPAFPGRCRGFLLRNDAGGFFGLFARKCLTDSLGFGILVVVPSVLPPPAQRNRSQTPWERESRRVFFYAHF